MHSYSCAYIKLTISLYAGPVHCTVLQSYGKETDDMVSGQAMLSVQVEMMSLLPHVLAHMHIHVHTDIHWALWRSRIQAKQRNG